MQRPVAVSQTGPAGSLVQSALVRHGLGPASGEATSRGASVPPASSEPRSIGSRSNQPASVDTSSNRPTSCGGNPASPPSTGWPLQAGKTDTAPARKRELRPIRRNMATRYPPIPDATRFICARVERMNDVRAVDRLPEPGFLAQLTAPSISAENIRQPCPVNRRRLSPRAPCSAAIASRVVWVSVAWGRSTRPSMSI